MSSSTERKTVQKLYKNFQGGPILGSSSNSGKMTPDPVSLVLILGAQLICACVCVSIIDTSLDCVYNVLSVKKIAIYCPVPTGQWYAPSAVNYSALSCTILHYLALSCTIMHYLAQSCTILHYLALSCTILHNLNYL